MKESEKSEGREARPVLTVGGVDEEGGQGGGHQAVGDNGVVSIVGVGGGDGQHGLHGRRLLRHHHLVALLQELGGVVVLILHKHLQDGGHSRLPVSHLHIAQRVSQHQHRLYFKAGHHTKSLVTNDSSEHWRLVAVLCAVTEVVTHLQAHAVVTA